MKTIRNVWAILMVAGSGLGSCAQDIPKRDVPSVVINDFMAAYPQAQDVEWELNGKIYHVDFEVVKTEYEVWYDASGKLLKTKQEMEIQALPQAVLTVIQKEFPNYKIDDADKVNENGNTWYVIELDGSPSDRILLISGNGKILENRIDY